MPKLSTPEQSAAPLGAAPGIDRYTTAEGYMTAFRETMHSYNIHPTLRQSQRDRVESLLAAGSEQTEREVALFLRRIPITVSSIDGENSPSPSGEHAMDASKVTKLADQYRAQTHLSLGRLAGTAITLSRKGETAFMQIFDDESLQDKVIRYLNRGHRRIILELGEGRLDNITSTDMRCPLILHHPAELVAKLRTKYAELGAGVVYHAVINSPAKPGEVLQKIEGDYRRLREIEEYKPLGDYVIKRKAITNPADPDTAVADAFKMFNTLLDDPTYNKVFTEGDIRSMIAKDTFGAQGDLDRALLKVDELWKIEKYKIVGHALIARHALKRPKTIRKYLDDLVDQMKIITDNPRYARYGTASILYFIEHSPLEAEATMARIDDAMKRIEADEECRRFGTQSVTDIILRSDDPLARFKEVIASYGKVQKRPE